MWRVLTVTGVAALTLLAGCSSPGLHGSGGPGGSAVSRAYGPGAYRLRGHARGYSAEVIVRQVKGGIAVLAAGGSYTMSNRLCVPGFSFVFNENGKERLKWAVPAWSDCLRRYASGDHLVCLSSAHVPVGATPGGEPAGRCDHPVFPAAHTGVDASLTAENKVTGVRYTVKSVGILLLPRSEAGGEQ